MPVPLTVTYDNGQRYATVRAEVIPGDLVSERFSLPGYALRSLTTNGAIGAATYTSSEMQTVAQADDADAAMVRIPGAVLAADGMVRLDSSGLGFEQAAYRFSATMSAGSLRMTAVFIRERAHNS